MEMLVLDENVATSLIAERERLGQDRYDEVHAGRYIVNAAPNSQHSYLVMETGFYLRGVCPDDEFAGDTVNVGTPDDFRVTDICVTTHESMGTVWFSDGVCRVAGEVLSPGERPLIKPDHYAAHGVGLYIEIDPMKSTVHARDLAGWHVPAADVAAALADLFDYDLA